MISKAVGTTWNTMELSKNEMPLPKVEGESSPSSQALTCTHLVPRSMARVSPPV